MKESNHEMRSRVHITRKEGNFDGVAVVIESLDGSRWTWEVPGVAKGVADDERTAWKRGRIVAQLLDAGALS